MDDPVQLQVIAGPDRQSLRDTGCPSRSGMTNRRSGMTERDGLQIEIGPVWKWVLEDSLTALPGLISLMMLNIC